MTEHLENKRIIMNAPHHNIECDDTVLSANCSNEHKMSRCSMWVKTQKEIVDQYEDIEDESMKILENNAIKCKFNKRKRSSGPGTHPKRRYVLNSEEQLTLECEWKKCHFITDSYAQFQLHVKCHMHELPIRKNEEDNEVYVCLWDICYFETSCSETIVKHVNFHAYHTKLKTTGLMIRELNILPRCTQDSVNRNTIPEMLTFTCDWVECGDSFQSPQEFYDHIKCHVISIKPLTKADNIMHCGWRGCNVKRPKFVLLLEHCRTHSGERLVACSHCGVMFSSNTKLIDHCYRQIPVELCAEDNFICTKCNKYFPSNRLLRDHLRLHINTNKCSLCDMTCPTPSTLAKHIRYRHVDDRVFKCSICPHACITKKDLEVHLTSHDTENKYTCEEDGCTFSCRSLQSWTRHVNGHHNEEMPQLYRCHCCESKFVRGAELTKHLINGHGFYWPPGHSRFTYKADAEGFYRLQTTRYESIEVSEEILNTTINNELMQSNQSYEIKVKMPMTNSEVANVIIKSLDDTHIYPSSYGLEHTTISNTEKDAKKIVKYKSKNNCRASRNDTDYLMKEESNHTDSNLGSIKDFSVMKRYLKENKNVVITIEDVDSKGKIITSEVVDTDIIVVEGVIDGADSKGKNIKSEVVVTDNKVVENVIDTNDSKGKFIK